MGIYLLDKKSIFAKMVWPVFIKGKPIHTLEGVLIGLASCSDTWSYIWEIEQSVSNTSDFEELLVALDAMVDQAAWLDEKSYLHSKIDAYRTMQNEERWNKIGDVYFDKGLYDQSYVCYENSIRIKVNAHALLNQGLLQAYLGDMNKAQELVKKAYQVKEEPKKDVIYQLYRFSWAYGWTFEEIVSVDSIIEIAKRHGEEVDLRFLMDYYLKENERPKAMEYYWRLKEVKNRLFYLKDFLLWADERNLLEDDEIKKALYKLRDQDAFKFYSQYLQMLKVQTNYEKMELVIKEKLSEPTWSLPERMEWYIFLAEAYEGQSSVFLEKWALDKIDEQVLTQRQRKIYYNRRIRLCRQRKLYDKEREYRRKQLNEWKRAARSLQLSIINLEGRLHEKNNETTDGDIFKNPQ